MKLERQQIIIGTVILALLAGFAMLLYKPLQSKIKAVKQAQQEKACVLQKANAEAQQLPAVRKQYAAMQGKTGGIAIKIPAERELGQFLQIIAEAMNRHNLKDQFVQPQTEVAMDKIMCIPVRLQCCGNVRDIFEFCKTLNSIGRLIRIETVEFKNSGQLDGMVSMAAQTNIYYEPGK